ncbi:MAG: PIN domain nuclease [Peptococcaceae bacterium]|nr:PIN domain nuclease [Peptococcaceae bacterium]
MTNEKFLADTSIWINAIRRDGCPEVRRWLKMALLEEKVLIAPPVKAEILSGAATKKQFEELKNDLSAVPMLGRDGEVWEYAAKLSFTLRRKGISVPMMDALIASWAIVNESILIHHDRRYQLIESVDPNLKAVSLPPFTKN